MALYEFPESESTGWVRKDLEGFDSGQPLVIDVEGRRYRVDVVHGLDLAGTEVAVIAAGERIE